MPVTTNGDEPAYLLGNDQRGRTTSTPDSFTIEGAGGHIVRESYGWGPNATVTFAFRDTAPSDMPDDTEDFSQFNATQIAQTLLALQSWSDVANINFTRVGGSGYSNNATMLFGNYDSGSEGAAAFAYYPGDTAFDSDSGDAWFNVSLDYNETPTYLNYGRHTLVHEIGHALGLDHPGDYNAGDGGPITYAANAEYLEDGRQYSVMSYFDDVETGADHGDFYPSAPQLDDITAVQLLYGANMTTRTGDTVYGFNSNTDRDFYTLTNATQKVIFAVWDAGGYDTLDFSGYSDTQTIDLRAGEFSSVGGLRYNVAVAQGVFIEKGIGGSGADTMYASSYATPVAVADITKLQTLTNHSISDAVSLNGKFGLAFDNAIVSSTQIPHATVNAVGDGELDYYKITVVAGQQITIDIDGTGPFNTDLDAFVSIVNGNGTVLKFNDDGMADVGSVKKQDSYLSYTFTTAGTFYIAVGSWPEADGATIGDAIPAGEAYTLNVSLTGATAPTTGTIKGSELDGGAGADTLYGNIGADILRGGTGVDSMRGGKGNDIYYVDNASDTLVEAKGEGTDTAYSSVSFVLRSGVYVENLTLTGSSNINGTGNGLDNILTGNSGTNVLSGGLGNDTYYVQNTGDVLVEAKSEGTDIAFSSVSFSLKAGSYVENLTLTGSANINGGGNGIANILTGNSGINVLSGGKGDDTYYVQNTGDSIVEAKGDGVDLVSSSVTFTLASGVYVENLTLTGSSNINGTGNGIDNVIRGNTGNNAINGGAGSDTLYGNAGNDTLDGGTSGADKMYGGTGNDTYYVNSSGDKAYEKDGEGTDQVFSSASYSLVGEYIENLTLTGSSGIYAKGNSLNNTLVGNSGGNKINGMAGQDTLTGGGGADTFIWDATSHSTVSKSDLITDLSNSDFIDLSRIDANVNASGTQHFTLVDAFTNTAGQVTLTYNASTNITSLQADTNGDGVADMLVRITGDHDDFDNFIFGGG